MSIHSIQEYYQELEKLIQYGGSKKETAIRGAFYGLLNTYAKQKGFILIPEITVKGSKGKNVTPDGTIKDSFRQDWGYWESKDEADDIDVEIDKKFARGYPKDNIIFEDGETAILIQNGQEAMRVQMKDPKKLDGILNAFIGYERPEVRRFRDAIEHFKEDIPRVTDAIREMIDLEEKSNENFVKVRNEFLELCKQSINPEIVEADIREMMIQHILTEDIFNVIFDETQFHRENNIARELEKVIGTFFTGDVKRGVLGRIQHYYQTINAAASNIADHHEKQKFLKVLYETFYKSYNPKAADRLGVVYTPNEIVNFMIESTDYLLNKHFGRFLEDKNVEILDPASGTGTFICDIIDYLRKDKVEHKYKNEIHANEIAILPYYIANLNIEYTYKQKTGNYEEFKNLCFVDTLDNLGFEFVDKQYGLFGLNKENTERIKRQNERKISVIIGNPPYNAKQANYNFQNANKAYKIIDNRIKKTYIEFGTAQNQIVVYDMYTRFYRWAMDRIGDYGIIALITNRSFIDGMALDGFRKCIQDDFDFAYIIDTKSDVRTNPKIAGTTHNVFGIQTGVAIMFLVKHNVKKSENSKCSIQYFSMDDYWLKEKKLQWLSENKFKDIPFEHVRPNEKNNWINLADNNFEDLLCLMDKNVKTSKDNKAIFKNFSVGLKTQRDEWVYDYSKEVLEKKMKYFVDVYKRTLKDEEFEKRNSIKWDEDLTSYLKRKIEKKFTKEQIVYSIYRPYTLKNFYFDKNFNGRTYQWFDIYRRDDDNKYVVIPGLASPKEFHTISSKYIVDLNCLPAGCQCLPLYVYNSVGERVDNITDWGLEQFKQHYKSKKISKGDIFYYTYAVLHNPAYRKKYELNLKREFPRIPFYDNFNKWRDWGKKLMDLHIGYETVKPFELKSVDFRASGNDNGKDLFDASKKLKAKLKADKEKGTIELDETTTITGIPKETWEYKLGNRSALEWILDQYKEKKPTDPTIAEKFNTYRFADYKEQVIDLLKRVTTVSVETMKIIREMETEK